MKMGLEINSAICSWVINYTIISFAISCAIVLACLCFIGYTSIADVRDYIVRSIDDILGSCDRLLQCVFGEHKVLDVTAEGARSIIYTRNNINRAVVLQITGDVWFPRDFHVHTAMNEAATMLPRTPFLSILTSEIVAPPGVMIILNGNVEGFIFSNLFARRFSTDRLVFIVQDTERQHHEQQQA